MRNPKGYTIRYHDHYPLTLKGHDDRIIWLIFRGRIFWISLYRNYLFRCIRFTILREMSPTVVTMSTINKIISICDIFAAFIGDVCKQ